MSVEKAISETAAKYGTKIGSIIPDPDQLTKCPVCNNDFIVAEVFPDLPPKKELETQITESFEKQMNKITSMVDEGSESLRSAIRQQRQKIGVMEEEIREIGEERDMATARYMTTSPALDCLRDIVVIVKTVNMNVSALIKAKESDRQIMTTLGDAVSAIQLKLIEAFPESPSD